jgi:hypothetical protein
MGKLIPLPEEITEGMAPDEAPKEIPRAKLPGLLRFSMLWGKNDLVPRLDHASGCGGSCLPISHEGSSLSQS